MLNFGTTGMTVLMRSIYNAFGAGAISFLTTWQVTDELRDALIIGLITGLGALGFRGGIEGLSDMARDSAGTVLPGDVAQTKTTAASTTAANVAAKA